MRHLATAKKLWKLILLLSRVMSEVCIDTQNPPSQNEHTHTYLHLTGVFGGHDAASPTFKIYVSGCLGGCEFVHLRHKAISFVLT